MGVLLVGLIYIIDQELEEKAFSTGLASDQAGSPTPDTDIQEKTGDDFPSTEAGTLNGWLEVPPSTPLDDTVVLFSSSSIPGLAIVYYPRQKRIISGLPPMVAEGIDLHDGGKHNVIYTFQKNGLQALLIDGKVVSSADYHPYDNSLTGMVVGVTLGKVSPLLENLDIT